MSSYSPPENILPIFNENEYTQPDSTLTQGAADDRYLKLSGGIETGLVSFANGFETTLSHSSAGTVGAPTVSFTTDPNTGLYSLAPDNLGISVGGSNKIDFTTTDINAHEGILIDYQGGSTQVGFSRSDGNTLATIEINAGNDFVFTNGTGSADFLIRGNSGGGNDFRIEFLDLFLVDGGIDATTAITTKKQIQSIDGTALAPAYSFTARSDVGMYQKINDVIGFSTNGLERLTIADSQIVAEVQMKISDGSALNPSLTFSSDSDVGLYLSDVDELTLVSNSQERIRIHSVGTEITGRVTLSDGAESIPAISFQNDQNSGIYSIGADNIGISCGADKKIDISSSRVLITDPLEIGNSLEFSTTTGIQLDQTSSAVLSFNGQSDGLKEVRILNPNQTTTSADASQLVIGRSYSTRNAMLLKYFYVGSGSTSNYLSFQGRADANEWRLRQDGVQLSPVSTTWTVISDERTKKNIKNAPSSVEKLKQLQCKEWIKKDENNTKGCGLVANDLIGTDFEDCIVKIGPSKIFNDGKIIELNDTIGINYDRIYMSMLKSIQELTERVEIIEKV
jgi:hypothetical protein